MAVVKGHTGVNRDQWSNMSFYARVVTLMRQTTELNRYVFGQVVYTIHISLYPLIYTKLLAISYIGTCVEMCSA